VRWDGDFQRLDSRISNFLISKSFQIVPNCLQFVVFPAESLQVVDSKLGVCLKRGPYLIPCPLRTESRSLQIWKVAQRHPYTPLRRGDPVPLIRGNLFAFGGRWIRELSLQWHRRISTNLELPKWTSAESPEIKKRYLEEHTNAAQSNRCIRCHLTVRHAKNG
jgi:hypothetical protein